MLLSYPSLNFGFSSWMKPEHLRLLRQQSEVNWTTLHNSNPPSPHLLRLVRFAAQTDADLQLASPTSLVQLIAREPKPSEIEAKSVPKTHALTNRSLERRSFISTNVHATQRWILPMRLARQVRLTLLTTASGPRTH